MAKMWSGVTPRIFYDLVHFDHARHILYDLKMNISTVAITATNPLCPTLTNGQRIIILLD